MKRKIVKIFVILITLIMLISVSLQSIAEASMSENFKGSLEEMGDAKNSAQKILSSILEVIRLIGASIAIIILIVIACKYIIASAGDRADIKKYAINYVIGALILFGASGIASILQSFVNSAVGSAGGGE